MTTPFLAAFAESVLGRLSASHLVELAPGGTDRAVLFVANWLGTEARGGSLLSGLEAALLACPEVVELHADLDDLKQIVEALG